MMPDPGIPRLGRWHLAWVLCLVVWAAVAWLSRSAIDIWVLDGFHRYLVLAVSLPCYWLSASRIFDWGRQRPNRGA